MTCDEPNTDPERKNGMNPRCPLCRDTGVLSTYWGEIFHANYGRLKVDGEHELDLPPGGVFYGGSSHQQCRCRKAVTAHDA